MSRLIRHLERWGVVYLTLPLLAIQSYQIVRHYRTQDKIEDALSLSQKSKIIFDGTIAYDLDGDQFLVVFVDGEFITYFDCYSPSPIRECGKQMDAMPIRW